MSAYHIAWNKKKQKLNKSKKIQLNFFFWMLCIKKKKYFQSG